MASQEVDEMETSIIPSTQAGRRSNVRYAWVIVFLFDPNEPRPFKLFRLTHFLKTDFPWKLIAGTLEQTERIIKRDSPKFPEHKFGLFVKIEKGMNVILIFFYFHKIL